MPTDANGVTVSNGYADNNAPYDVATATIDGKSFQKVIPCDASGTPTPTGADSLVISTDTGTISALGNYVCSTTPRYLVIELWCTAAATATLEFESLLVAGTPTTAMSQLGTLFSSGLPSLGASASFAAPVTSVELVGHFSPVNAAQFQIRCSAYSTGTINYRITNLNWPANAQDIYNSYKTAQFTNTLGFTVAFDPSLSYAGITAMCFDPDTGDRDAIPTSTDTPGASHVGVVTRNIPSGTQNIAITAVSATVPAYGKIAGSSLTTSYQTVLTMGGAGKILQIWNSTEVPVIFSYDGGTTANLELGPYESESVDYAANGMTLASGTIQAKLVSGSAPVNGGSVRAKVTR